MNGQYQINLQSLYFLSPYNQRYTYRVLQKNQMKLILVSVWADWAVMGSAETALKFKYEIWIG